MLTTNMYTASVAITGAAAVISITFTNSTYIILTADDVSAVGF